MTITAKLNQLLQTIEDQGYPLNDDLNPGLDRSAIQSLMQFFPCELPDEIMELYQWRNGQINGEWQEGTVGGFPLFRDNYFLPLHKTKEYYNMILDFYYEEEYSDFLIYSFPFATFEGNTWVICCREQSLNPGLKYPIVSVFEGIDIYFKDMYSMLDTIVAWYKEGAYTIKPDRSGKSTPLLDTNETIERRVWQRLNPGLSIFN